MLIDFYEIKVYNDKPHEDEEGLKLYKNHHLQGKDINNYNIKGKYTFMILDQQWIYFSYKKGVLHQ